jgi:hypothetical protein
MRSAATLGGVAFGTTSTSTTAFTFAPDGRYQYYSASLTTGNSNVGTGDNGSSGTATSGNAAVSFGQNGVNTFAQGSHQDEGTYAIDGYTLEFRSAKGRVTRAFAFPWDSAKYKNHLVIGGVTYTSSNDR